MPIGFETERRHLGLNPKPAFSLSSAADLILLPKPETTGYARGFRRAFDCRLAASRRAASKRSGRDR
jgi:hypothetical protein